MGRIREFIEVDGRKCWTLFDTGAKNTYIVPEVAALLLTTDLKQPYRSGLGGGVKEAKETAILEAVVDGCPITTQAMVVDQIGEDDEGKAIEVLFGALAMQQWNIRPVPETEKLDMSRYTRDFTEF